MKNNKSYMDLIDSGKRIFNFHPKEEFENIEQLLEVSRKSMKNVGHYTQGAATFAGYLARFIDSQIILPTGMDKCERDGGNCGEGGFCDDCYLLKDQAS